MPPAISGWTPVRPLGSPRPGLCPALPLLGVPARPPGPHGTQPLRPPPPPALEPSGRHAPLPAVLLAPPKGRLDRELAGRNEDITNAVSLHRHSHLDCVSRLTELHLGAYIAQAPPPTE